MLVNKIELKTVILRMDFLEVVGQNHLKKHLQQTVKNGRIPHTQLFIGKTGSGILPLAIAYAHEILCSGHKDGSEAQQKCAQKVKKLAHPDLHFVFPVNTNDTIKKNPVSDNFIETWREFVFTNPYASLFEWLQLLGIENKQGNISKFEAEAISKKLSLKAYEGGYKIMIVWMADKMNVECANKILKLVEEPPEKTVLLLLTEHEEKIISTILSRCQRLHFPLLSETNIASYLADYKGVEQKNSLQIARKSNGDVNHALQLINNSKTDILFEKWFITWVRAAFRAKGNKAIITNLLEWSDTIAKEGRETQKQFLAYCIETFRQALIKNYGVDDLVFFESSDPKFSIKKFAPFVHNNNILEITDALEKATYHIERNGNSKIIFTDLSMQLTRFIHKKEVV